MALVYSFLCSVLITSWGGQRIGVAKGDFEVPDNIDADNEEVAALFLGGARCVKLEVEVG